MSTKTIFKPILFNTEMVQAILAGRKTQTRRVIKPQPVLGEDSWDFRNIELNNNEFYPKIKFDDHKSVKIKKDDILWVRESYGITAIGNMYKANVCDPKYDKPKSGWKPSLFMPKEACRIFLKVTNVRCERLQDISESDAIAEGIKPTDIDGRYKCYSKRTSGNWYTEFKALLPIKSFESLWDSINAKKHPWESNPWVWVYEFEVTEKPQNFLL